MIMVYTILQILSNVRDLFVLQCYVICYYYFFFLKGILLLNEEFASIFNIEGGFWYQFCTSLYFYVNSMIFP